MVILFDSFFRSSQFASLKVPLKGAKSDGLVNPIDLTRFDEDQTEDSLLHQLF